MKIINFSCDYEKTSNTDERFTDVKIWVAHEGWNLNDTYFSADDLATMAEKSLGKIPIVAYLEYDEEKDFAGHEEAFVIEIDEDGEEKVYRKYLGMPYGAIPPNPNWEIEEKDGLKWLTVKGYIWNKFDGSELFEDEKGQSMELLSSDLEYVHTDDLDDDHEAKQNGKTGYVIQKATFDALCALGDNYTPAMQGSVIENISNTFSQDKIKNSFDKMFEQYSEFAEGGENVPEENYELSLKEKFNMLGEIVANYESVQYEDYEYPKYTVSDVKQENVYFMDNETWEYFGAEYELSEDGELTVDFENMFKAIMTFIPLSEAYTDEKEYNFVKDMVDNKLEDQKEKLNNEYQSELEEVQQTLETKKDEYSTLEEEVESLRDFKSEINRANKKEYVNKVANLEDNEKEELSKEIDNYTMTELKDEVAKIIGNKSIQFTSDDTPNVDTFTNNEDKEVKDKFQDEINR